MNLKDKTKNQHYVSQAEQRLNAINPGDNKKHQKIYVFNLKDRENHSLCLNSDEGSKIEKTLSLDDLYSFDILGKEAERYNFEKLFKIYEDDVKTNTQSLMDKLPIAGSDIKLEILNIFAAKFLNFVRNPYSIKKVINTFPELANVHPTDPAHLSNFERIINGKKPQQQALCDQLHISVSEYTEWLAVIFLLLTPLKNGKPNLLEQALKGLLENPDYFICINIYTYDEKTCLLSDRGYSIPLQEKDHMAFDFNLCSNAFVRYIFCDISTLVPPDIPKWLIDDFKSQSKSIDVRNLPNNLEELDKYNKNVVYQCFGTVFNSSIECYGL